MILVFGKTGQVASELDLFEDTICLGRVECDLNNPIMCKEIIHRYNPDAVINATGYTDVDGAENEEDIANIVNGDAPGNMAAACQKLEIPLVHLSTDYVFDGSKDKPWNTADKTFPLNAYGKSKLRGELAIKTSGATFAIIRTSWVISAQGQNFVKTMLRLSESRKSLAVINDQIGGPTPARDIALACMKIANNLIKHPDKSGTYHYTGAPDISWYDLALKIFQMANIDVAVKPIAANEYPSQATRPLNSMLNCDSTITNFQIKRPDWEKGLFDILSELKVI